LKKPPSDIISINRPWRGSEPSYLHSPRAYARGNRQTPFGLKANVFLRPTEAELLAIRHSIQRGCPFGNEAWSKKTIRRLGLESTIRPRGRPRIAGT
jgi:alkylhydroperoxidase family enzyme